MKWVKGRRKHGAVSKRGEARPAEVGKPMVPILLIGEAPVMRGERPLAAAVAAAVGPRISG